MRLDEQRREQSRRFLSGSDWRVLVLGLAVISVSTAVLLYFSIPLADALSHYMMEQIVPSSRSSG